MDADVGPNLLLTLAFAVLVIKCAVLLAGKAFRGMATLVLLLVLLGPLAVEAAVRATVYPWSPLATGAALLIEADDPAARDAAGPILLTHAAVVAAMLGLWLTLWLAALKPDHAPPEPPPVRNRADPHAGGFLHRCHSMTMSPSSRSSRPPLSSPLEPTL